MKITGINGLGNKLKILLTIAFYIGIISLIALPFVFNKFGLKLATAIFVLYPNGIVMLVIMKKFIELFDSLKKNEPFCMKNVEVFKVAGKASLIESILWFIDFIYEIILVHSDDIVFNSTVLFFSVLFFGVFIALYILSELFKEATKYKEENELTI